MKIKKRKQALCEHNKRKSRCEFCGGASLCEHGILREVCKKCVGSQVCKHIRLFKACAKCNPRGAYRNYSVVAKRRNLVFNLTLDLFARLLESPCFYCGFEPSLGIDRVDNSLGYDSVNSAPCCKQCNQMKSNRSKEQFVTQCQTVVSYQSQRKLVA
jgi:hypothetical protein